MKKYLLPLSFIPYVIYLIINGFHNLDQTINYGVSCMLFIHSYIAFMYMLWKTKSSKKLMFVISLMYIFIFVLLSSFISI